MIIETFIAAHDADLVAECERSGQFAGLMDYRYLFLGNRPAPLRRRIVSRDWQDNVEHLPAFYDFTGWWTLARHYLIDRPHVMFLQYDMAPASPTLEADVAALLADAPGPVAFVPGYRSLGHWMLYIDGFEAEFRRGMMAIGVDVDAWPPFEQWPTSQGLAWRTVHFYEFMHWVRPLFDVWADSVWAGHLIERTVWAWCLERGIEPRYLLGAITHERRDCHGTGALMAGDVVTHAERAAVFGAQYIDDDEPDEKIAEIMQRERTLISEPPPIRLTNCHLTPAPDDFPGIQMP